MLLGPETGFFGNVGVYGQLSSRSLGLNSIGTNTLRTGPELSIRDTGIQGDYLWKMEGSKSISLSYLNSYVVGKRLTYSTIDTLANMTDSLKHKYQNMPSTATGYLTYASPVANGGDGTQSYSAVPTGNGKGQHGRTYKCLGRY